MRRYISHKIEWGDLPSLRLSGGPPLGGIQSIIYKQKIKIKKISQDVS